MASRSRSSQQRRRFFATHLALSAAYIALVALAAFLIPDEAPPSATVILLALLPGLVIVGWILNIGSLLLRMEDEYLRMLEVRKALVATGLTLGVCGGWGLVELFAAVPKLPVFFVFPLWCFGLAVGSIVNRLTLGEDGGEGCA